MTDNFDLIRSKLTFTEPGDCYYLQLLRRSADDPKPDGKADPAFHGNMHSRSFKDYFIKSLDDFDEHKEEIITICNLFNYRAYIRLNKRNYKTIDMLMFKHITDQICSGETFSSPHHLVSSAAGLANCSGKEKTWLIDVDAEYVPYVDKIMELIKQCPPFRGDSDMFIVPTKSGLHVITKTFNREMFNQLWNKDADLCKLPVVSLHKDNPTILYVR